MSAARRRFRIIKEIAEGGFGKVYLAEQISQDGFSRIVAVKLLHAKWSSHDEVVMRTRDEARLLGLIRHQHIVKVEDLTSIDGKCAIVMEYLEGVDLKWMITFLKERGEVFPRAALFEIILAVASAMDAAYNGMPLQGGNPLRVIHRDIKPSNIFVTVPGAVKVLDFGTARANFAEREAKTQALAFGSQGYMAPERMLGEEDTPAADVFSLGITLYELLALESFGRIPPRPNKFAAKVTERVADLPLDGSEEWVAQVRETLSLMLSYEPDDRPSASQLVEIMELLSQDAGDMQLRRFCRTTVNEAKDRLPDLDTGDPLAGTIVDEDMSSSFALDRSGGSPKPGGAPPTPALPTFQEGPPSLPGERGDSGPRALTDLEISAPQSRASKGGVRVGAAVGVLVLGFFGVVAVAVAGVAYFMLSGDAQDAVGTPDLPTEVEGTPEPEPAVEEPEAVQAGVEVVSPDSRTDVPAVKTLLHYSDADGGQVIIKGGGGYKVEWDGKADFDMGAVAEGRYSTIVTLSGGEKVRAKSFTVESGASSCEYTFDVSAKNWTGGCR